MDVQPVMRFVRERLFQWKRMRKDSNIRELMNPIAYVVINVLGYVQLRRKEYTIRSFYNISMAKLCIDLPHECSPN